MAVRDVKLAQAALRKLVPIIATALKFLRDSRFKERADCIDRLLRFG